MPTVKGKAPGFAGGTEVSVERSKAEIERLLERHSAEGYNSGWKAATETEAGWDVVQFVWKGKSIRFKVNRPPLADKVNTPSHVRNVPAYREQLAKQRWRLLLLVIKAKLEAVEAGVAVFEEEFLAFIVTNTGKTVGEIMLPRIEAATARNEQVQMVEGRG